MKGMMLVVIAGVALCAGCGGEDSGGGAGSGGAAGAGTGGATGQPGPGAYQPDYDTSGDFFTRMSQPADSGSVHGKVRIWYSNNVKDLPTSGPFVVPEGTVAIKDEFDASNAVIIKVVMVKKPAGYDPANQDWYYEARNPDHSVASDPVPGKPSLCIGCHQNAKSTDYLQGFALAN